MERPQSKDVFLRKVGFLNDEAEAPFHRSGELKSLGINHLTPAGVLYLLARFEDTREIISAITGKDAEQIEETAREFLTQKYKGEENIFTVNSQTESLVEQAVREAGGKMNAAGPEHLLLSMFSMPNAKSADSYEVLKKLNVDEKKVKESFDTFGLAEDITEKTALGHLAYIETKTANDNAINILSRLKRNPKGRLLISGESGSGKHTILTTIARAMKKEEFSGLKLKRLLEIKANSKLTKKVQERLKALGEANQDALFYIDLNTVTDSEAEKIANLPFKNPIIAVSPKVPVSNEAQGAWETVSISPYSLKEISEIITQHLRVSAGEAEDKLIRIEDEEKITKLLMQYGSTIYRRALPGSAIELLKQAIADVQIHGLREISSEKVAELLARQGANLSVEAMLKTNKEKILNVEDVLNKRIIGQNEAKKAISRHLRIKAAELSSDKRPIANFVFLGPTGVGKTEMSKALAYALFDNTDNMVRIDMSEYQESHTVSRLIGSPPGYVGYDQGGQLTEAARKRPFSVFLFDEIDKAHPDVLNPLLQVLDEGRLTDGKGNTVDFSQAIIIMTSNHGSSLFYDALETNQDIAGVRESVKKWFTQKVRPEFLNRLDEIIIFDPISKEDAALILDLILENKVLSPLSDKHKVEIELTSEVKDELLKQGFSPQLGARPLQRVIGKRILDPIASIMLKEELKSKLRFEFENGEIVVK